MGIDGVVLNWFKNYLDGRSQRVEIDGVLSDLCEIVISIMQGSMYIRTNFISMLHQ
jgi:hypothetical protein